MRVIDSSAVRAALPMGDAVAIMREAMAAFARGEVFQPMRTVLETPLMPGFTFVKPAFVGGGQPSFGMKVITFFPDNPKRGLPAISGFVALFDVETGVPAAIIDGGVVTEIRTAAVSGVATGALASADAGDLALLGTGAQARSHLEAMAAVRSLRRVRAWNRNPSSTHAFADWAYQRGFAVEECASVAEAVDGADLICTVTSSREPVLDAAWLAPGVHINAVGAFQADTRELQTNVVTDAVIVVDSRAETSKAAGDLLIPIAEGALEEREFAELGEVLVGTREGRVAADQITVFESLGLALEDVAAAAHVAAEAERRGLGVEVAL